MTKEEFLSLKRHDRIKYTGARPVTTVLGEKPSKVWLTKGVVVQYIYENDEYVGTGNTWMSRKATGKKILYLSYFGGSVTNVDPSEWTISERRGHVERDTEYKYARAYVKRTCMDFKHGLRRLMSKYKSRMDSRLDCLPLDKKLKLIMEVDNEYKKWFGIINMDPDEALKAIEKAYEGENAPTPEQHS